MDDGVCAVYEWRLWAWFMGVVSIIIVRRKNINNYKQVNGNVMLPSVMIIIQ